MKSITVQIVVDRAAAILAGKAHYGPTTVAIDPGKLTADQRDELASLPITLNALDDLELSKARSTDPLYISSVGYTTPIVEPTPEAIATALDEYRRNRLAHEAAKVARAAEEKARAKAMAESKARAWLDLPANRRAGINLGVWESSHPVRAAEYLDGDLRANFEATVAEAMAAATRLNDEKKARDEATRKAAAEQERIKAQALDGFVVDHCTEVQQKRRAANLMPDEEVLRLIRDHVFRPLDHLPRYDRMTKSDFPDATDVEFETADADGATDAQFEAMEAIKNLVPDAAVTLRNHIATVCSYDADEAQEVRDAFLVAIQWHGWSLSREYAA